MPSGLDAALAELAQVPLEAFVAERKRLAQELKAAGDKAGAAVLAKRARPPVSAWVVNQLWWHARDAFDAALAGAARLRDGDLSATAAHRDALLKLRTRATTMLTDAGHGATEATLRRVAQTVTAIAAAGSWDPDLPGTLSADRDPPGFDAAMLAPVTIAEGAEAARRVVEQTEELKRKAAAVAAAAVASRAEPVTTAPVSAPVVAAAPAIPAALAPVERVGPAPPVAPVAPAPPVRPAPVLVSIPLDEPEPEPATERARLEAQLLAARETLSAKELVAEHLRAQLAEARQELAAARARVDALQAELDDAPR